MYIYIYIYMITKCKIKHSDQKLSVIEIPKRDVRQNELLSIMFNCVENYVQNVQFSKRFSLQTMGSNCPLPLGRGVGTQRNPKHNPSCTVVGCRSDLWVTFPTGAAAGLSIE